MSMTLWNPPTLCVPTTQMVIRPASMTTDWNTSVQITALRPPYVEQARHTLALPKLGPQIGHQVVTNSISRSAFYDNRSKVVRGATQDRIWLILRCVLLQSSLLHCLTLQCALLPSPELLSTPLYSTLFYTTLHYTTLHYTTLHYTTLHYTTLHYSTLHYTTLHYTTLHYTTLHYTTLHYSHYTTLLYYSYSTLLCSTLLLILVNVLIRGQFKRRHLPETYKMCRLPQWWL